VRILWHGVKGSIKTGYGAQTKLFTPRIRDAGHEIAINSRLDQYQTGVDSDGIMNFASGSKWDMMGNDYAAVNYAHYEPDVVISMCDAFTCEPTIFDKFAWYPWVMIDSKPITWENLECLKACRRPIACTRDGEEQLRAAGFDPFYVPLAIDRSIYKPLDGDVRAEASKIVGVPIGERFFVVMNSANHSNPSRKNFASAFKAWAQFEKLYPDALLYVHAEAAGKMWHGEDLWRVKNLYGCKNIVFAPQYEYATGLIGSEHLALIYNAADVLLHTAKGEGFGLPIVEAQACGTPVIAPDFGAMREVNRTGIRCCGELRMTRSGSEQMLVDVERVAGALEAVCLQNGAHESRRAISDCVEQYDIRNVMKDNFLPMLDEIKHLEGIE